MKDLYINYSNHRESEEAQKQYGDWSITNNISLTGASLEETRFGEKLSFDFDIVDNKIYLVYGVYSTGDSFGHETGVYEFLELFPTYEEANEYKEKVEIYNELIKFLSDSYGHTPKNKANKIKNFLYRLGDNVTENKSWGSKYSFVWKGNIIHFPWGGYFESLDYVGVEDFNI